MGNAQRGTRKSCVLALRIARTRPTRKLPHLLNPFLRREPGSDFDTILP